MKNIDEIIEALERCKICDTSIVASKEGRKAYIDCEYTTGLYCRKDILLDDILFFLKKQKQITEHRQPEIIRCKDCNNRGTSDCLIEELCNGWIPSDDWFCADGKRKEI